MPILTIHLRGDIFLVLVLHVKIQINFVNCVLQLLVWFLLLLLLLCKWIPVVYGHRLLHSPNG